MNKTYSDADMINEKRLDEIERKVSVFLKKIQDDSIFKNELKKLNDCFESFVKKFEEHEQKIEAIKNYVTSESTCCKQQDKKASDQISKLNEKSNSISKEIDKVKNSIDFFHTIIRDSQFTILKILDDSQKLVVKKPDLEAHQNHIEGKLSEINSFHGLISSKIKTVQTLAEHNSIANNVLDTRLQVLETLFVKFQGQFLKDLSQLKKESNDLTNSIIDKFSKEFDKRIEDILKKVDTSPDTISALENRVETKIQNVLLDSKNAIMKSSQLTQKITTMEKKIENLYLLQNK